MINQVELNTTESVETAESMQRQTEPEKLEVLYQDEYIIAVNKPSGLLVHRSLIDKRETRFAMQIVRDQIGQYVYPVHRLDKPTSGVLLMALSSDIARALSQQFENRQIQKTYFAIVRGHLNDSGVIDYPLVEQLDKMTDKKANQQQPAKEAITEYLCLLQSQINVEINRYPQSRFSLLKLLPKTGRKHQIRRHLAHLRHPIIYDVNYGDNKYNKYFKTLNDETRLALHACQLDLLHPVSQQKLTLIAKLDSSFKQLLAMTNLNFKEDIK
ncbi:tRNA pseudouridine(65) synthase TruC [Catenovulum sp. 2E275]|uniref:tRNA pseudouridine(65) synthase TruC n=1 Tax=Catenovulum sp. 2E275 TaxID=2980497 RepID=UPI0021D0CD3D|nr:tRNA pseudouridine(65) synthase TruC [Catenovulum sp. 2E275]MCU4676961.1 tRNA pseudouridine(65) synthase TruC [Catenovulum sp. 2E275]